MLSLLNRFPGQSLFRKGMAGVYAKLPPATSLVELLDRHAPWEIKQALIELSLNHLFAEAVRAGEFDPLEGRTLRLELSDSDCGVTLGLWRGRLRLAEGRGEATIRGNLDAFRVLAERREDPDQLFFQRRLVIEGDTELGLWVKNLLDGMEWEIGVRRFFSPAA